MLKAWEREIETEQTAMTDIGNLKVGPKQDHK